MKNEEYYTVVEKIIESKSFGHSKTYANLLRYLLRCTLANEVPKETTIAQEIFGKSDFDPSNSTLIRVYAYNLRKKITSYYNKEGKEDKLVVKIPKGGYEIFFEEKTLDKLQRKNVQKKWLMLSGFLFVVALIYLIASKNKPENENYVAQSELWSDFFLNEKPAMIVLGDLFVFSETNSETGRTYNVRDPRVNSMEMYEKLASTYDKTKFELNPISYTYLVKNSSMWIDDLVKLFYPTNKDYVIRTMSRFNTKELSENNLIVVGMLKTLGVFKNYFKNSNYLFETSDSLNSSEKIIEKGINYSANGNPDSYHTDYAVMVKIPGPNNNLVYLFGGLWDTGTSQSLKNFTDSKLIYDLELEMKKKFGEIPEYYEIFFEVNGIDRMELNSKIISINEIKADTNIWDID